MKRIETLEIREQKAKRRQMIVSSVLILLMLGSSLGYALLSGNFTSRTDNSSGNEGAVNGRWFYDTSAGTFNFAVSLTSAANIGTPVTKTIGSYQGQTLYVDDQTGILESEAGIIIGRIVSKIQPACYGSCTRDLPEKDCSSLIITFNESEEQRITEKDNCIFISGNITTIDAFFYKVTGIKQ